MSQVPHGDFDVPFDGQRIIDRMQADWKTGEAGNGSSNSSGPN